MSEKEPSEGRKSLPHSKSAKEMRADLLRRAWRGETSRSPAEIIQEILARKRAVALPAGQGHDVGLRDVIPGQDGQISRQNCRNFLSGIHARYSAADYVPDPDKAASVSTGDGLGDYKNTEIYKIFTEMVQAEKSWLAENPDTGKPELLLEILRKRIEEEDFSSTLQRPEHLVLQ